MATRLMIRGDSRRALQLLEQACKEGNVNVVSQFIADNENDAQHVDWERLIEKAYGSQRLSHSSQRPIRRTPHGRNVSPYVLDASRKQGGHEEVVRCIRDSGRVSTYTQLYYSCLLGDLKFVLMCITTERDKGESIDWEKLIRIAHDNQDKYIVRCIRDNKRVSVKLQVYYSCMWGDVKFVSQCINENKDQDQDVEWENMMKIAHENNYKDLVRCIRDSGRVPLDVPKMLTWACELGDVNFVSLCITDNRDIGHTINWGEMMSIAYSNDAHVAGYIVESGRYGLADLYKSIGSRFFEKNFVFANSFTDEDMKKKTDFVIQHTSNINAEMRPGLTALHVFCHELYKFAELSYCKGIITGLVENGADVNKKGYLGRTVLHVLCHGQNDDINAIMQDKPIKTKTETQQAKKSHQPLSVRAQKHDDPNILEILEVIMAKGRDVNVTDDSGQTPLHMLSLCFGGNRIVTLLLENGADVDIRDKEGRTPLALAAQNDNYERVRFFCNQGCDMNMPTFEGETPLYLSVLSATSQQRVSQSTSILCKLGAKVDQADAYKVTPLAVACESNNIRVLELLLQNNADPGYPDREGRTPLHKTVIYGSIDSCTRLIKAKVDMNALDSTGCSALYLAVYHNNTQIVKVLLEAGCNPNVENNLGNIPLHIATSVNKMEICEILLQEGSYIDHKNNYGNSPLIDCVRHLDSVMMKYLTGKNANLQSVDNMQRSLIHIVVTSLLSSSACKLQECKDVITSLTQQGLSINAVDINKQTPLHLASKDRSLELVSFLVVSGANLNARDSFGHTPLMNTFKNPYDHEVFCYLFDETVSNLTDGDFFQLHRLSHWLNVDDVKEALKSLAPVQLVIANKPQNVRTLKIRYDSNLEKWLRSDQEELPEFMSEWLPSLQSLTYVDHPEINKVIHNFLKDLQDDVGRHSPIVAYLIKICGSVEEKTKSFAQDEYDCSCVQQNIRFEMFDIPTKEDHKVWKAFVHLKCKDEFQNELQLFLDDKKRLSQGKLCHHFGKAIGKSLANPALWAKYPQLQRVSAKDISAGDRRICTMHVIWSDEICPLLTIDIDLAPVIDLLEWKPSWCNQHPLVNEIRCIALPKWKMSHDVEMNLMEIGVHSWAPLFQKMPHQMRQGYRLAKIVRGSAVCPRIPQTPDLVQVKESQMSEVEDETVPSNEYYEWSNAGEFMNTYLLKQVIMHEYTAWYDEAVEGLNPSIHTDLYWARRIYSKMEEAFEKRELYSWFIPSYNLLNEDKFVQFQETAILYARLCRRLLTEDAAAHFRRAYMGLSSIDEIVVKRKAPSPQRQDSTESPMKKSA